MQGATPSCEAGPPQPPAASQSSESGHGHWAGREEEPRRALLPWEVRVGAAGRSELANGGSPGSGEAVDAMGKKAEALLSDRGLALRPWNPSASHPRPARLLQALEEQASSHGSHNQQPGVFACQLGCSVFSLTEWRG